MLLVILMVVMGVSPAAAKDLAWSKSNLPVAGADGKWFRDTGIGSLGPLAKAIDGTLYCYVSFDDGVEIIIDGKIAGTEWDAATSFNLVTNGPTAYVINDDRYLYVAFDNVSTDGSVSFNTYKAGAFSPETLTTPYINWDGTQFWDTRKDPDGDGTFDQYTRVDGTGVFESVIGTGKNKAATEIKVPLANLRLVPGDAIKIMFEFVEDSITYVYPSGASTPVPTSYEDLTLGAEATLMKSTDGGHTWSKLTEYKGGAIADFATSSEDANILYVTEGFGLYKTTDAGSSFSTIGTATISGQIKSIAVGYLDGNPSVFAGTSADAYLLNEATYAASWQPLALNKDVLAIETSPNFAAEGNPQLVAVATDGTSTYVYYNYGGVVWGDGVLLGSFKAVGADIAFPENYDSDKTSGLMEFWVAADGGTSTGGMFRVATDTAFNKDAHNHVSVDLAGPVGGCTIVGGTTDGDVRQSTDGIGTTWNSAKNPPSGDSDTWVVMADDFLDSGTVYAAVSGADQAFSMQVAERKWAQISLIDTDVDRIDDIAFGSSRFQITTATNDIESLWRYGDNWERVQVKGKGVLDLVRVSVNFEADNAVFWADKSEGELYRSTDGGSYFAKLVSATPATITGFVPLDANTVIVGTNGGTYKTINNGATWNAKADCSGAGDIISLVLSPAFDGDGTILAGDSNGEIYKSTDAGKTWSQITKDIFSGATGGNVFGAFDPGFADNGIFYAAGDDGTGLVIDRYEDGWKNISETITEGIEATGLVCSADGTLYATGSGAGADGVFRSLNPTAKLADVVFEQVIKDVTAALSNLRLTGSNILWGTENDVWTYTDTLTGVPINLEISTEHSVSARWDAMTGATEYQVKCNTRDDFKGVAKFPTNAKVVNNVVTEIVTINAASFANLSDGTTYYIKVRVAEPVLSRWSEVASFITKMGAAVWSPFPAAGNFSPTSKDVDPIQTLFQWNPSGGAEGYEFQISDNETFAGADTKKVKIPAYAWPGDLEYGKTYYWRVRAYKTGTYSEWATAIFTTAEETVPPPAPAPPAPAPPAPAPVVIPTAIPAYLLWTIIGVGAVLVISLIVLIFRRVS